MKKYLSIILAFISMLLLIQFANANNFTHIDQLPKGLVFQLELDSTKCSDISMEGVQLFKPIGQQNWYLGTFRSLKEAEDYQHNAISEAKVVAFFNHKPISLEDASILSNNRVSDDIHPQDQTHQSGLNFSVQIGTYSKPIPNAFFAGVTQIFVEVTSDSKFKYTTGECKSSAEARLLLEELQANGYSDALIVPYLYQQRISDEKAYELEFGEALPLAEVSFTP